jgi:hypothetical protein
MVSVSSRQPFNSSNKSVMEITGIVEGRLPLCAAQNVPNFGLDFADGSAYSTSTRRAALFRPGFRPVVGVVVADVPCYGRSLSDARVAQLVEHAIENRSVGGSIPSPGTI